MKEIEFNNLIQTKEEKIQERIKNKILKGKKYAYIKTGGQIPKLEKIYNGLAELIEDVHTYVYENDGKELIEKINKEQAEKGKKGWIVKGKDNGQPSRQNSYKQISNSEYYVGTANAGPGITSICELISRYCESKNLNFEKFVLKYDIDKEEVKGYESNDFNREEYVDMKEKIKDLIKNGKIYQIILTGAPGTGKTYMAKEISKELGSQLSSNDDKNYKLVQFHPSYDYTDFVEGIRPIANENNEMIFKKFDGVFKAFCRKVATLNKENKNNENEDKLYFFIIDEINRADLSKVLGELMLGLEKDKREEPIETQYSNIKTYYDPNINKDINEKGGVFEKGFFIPKNVVIIGTMNDIDRSVESMDFALRRRFTWIEVEVDEKSLTQAFKNKLKFCGHIEDEKDREIIINRIVALNKTIKDKGAEYNLNKHYFISQGYFTNIPNIEETKDVKGLLKWVWKYRIKSLIEEYVRAENSETIDTFIKECEKAFLIDGE